MKTIEQVKEKIVETRAINKKEWEENIVSYPVFMAVRGVLGYLLDWLEEEDNG